MLRRRRRFDRPAKEKRRWRGGRWTGLESKVGESASKLDTVQNYCPHFFFFATPRGFISVDLNKLKNLSNLGQLEPYDYLDLDFALGLEGWDIQTFFLFYFI